MNPGAVSRFQDSQQRLLQETYRRAWEQGVAGYEPDDDPDTAAEEDEGQGAAVLASGAGAALLYARASKYRAPITPDPEAEASALRPASESLNNMVGELMQLAPSPEHVDAAAEYARAGGIVPEGIGSYAESLALEDWLDSNAWRMGAGESVAWAGEQSGYAQAAGADGQLLEWLPEADDHVCDDCEALGDMPPMPIEEWPTHPGMGDTICNVGCRCVLQVADEQTIGPSGELPELSDSEEAFVTELTERREPYVEGPVIRPSGPLVGDRPLGQHAERMYQPDANQVFRDHDGLYAQAEVTKPEFDRIITQAGDLVGAEPMEFKTALRGEAPAVILAPLKNGEVGGRAYEKVNTKYKGDWGRLKDVVRGTIAVPREEDLLPALRAIERAVAENPGWKVTGIENRWTLEAGSKVNTGANGFGYRDVSMHLVAPNGHVAELQLNTIAMVRAKELEGGHILYEEVRKLLERDRLAQPWTKEEAKLYANRKERSVALYHGAEREGTAARNVAEAVVAEAKGLSTDEAAAKFIDGSLKDTLTRYTRADGKLDPQRQALHKEIIARLLAPHSPQEHMHALFTAGGPASGKSKFLKMPGAPPDAVVVDPDIIRKLLPDYHEIGELGREDIAAAATHEEASMIAKELTSAATDSRRNLIIDGVGDSAPKKFAGKIQQAIDAGYKTDVSYMHLSTPEALVRSEERRLRHGRAVPEDVLRQKHAEVSARYHEVLELKGVNRVSLYDNTVAKGEEPIFVSTRGADGKLVVHEPERQAEFEAKAAEEIHPEGAPARQLLDTSAIPHGEAEAAAREVEAAIAKVVPGFDHVLPVVELPSEDSATARLVQRDGHPAIGIHADSPARTLVPAMTHEIGHYIDRYVLGDGSDFGNYGDRLYKLMRDSPTMVELRKGEITGLGKFEDDPMTRQLYMGREQYARAFAQAVAEDSDNTILTEWLAKHQRDPVLRAEVWRHDEFAPIRAKLEAQLRHEGPAEAAAAQRVHDALIGDLSALTPEHRQDVLDQVAKLPDDVAQLLANRGVKVEGADSVYAHAHYAPRERVVKVDDFGFVTNPGQAPTVLHELGHAFDAAVGNVSKDPAFRAIHKDAKPKKGGYFSRGFGSGPYKTDPRQELFAEAAAQIWNGTDSPDFELTSHLRELVTELPRVHLEGAPPAPTQEYAQALMKKTTEGATGTPAKETQAAKMVERLDPATATPRDLVEVGRAIRGEADQRLGAKWESRIAKLKAKWLEVKDAAKQADEELYRAQAELDDLLRKPDSIVRVEGQLDDSPEIKAAKAKMNAAGEAFNAANDAEDKAREAYQSLRESFNRFKRPEALREVLADIRSMGGELATAPGMAALPKGALAQAAQHLPTEWLQRSNVAGDVKSIIVPEGRPSRANISTPHRKGAGDAFFYTDSTIEAGVKEWADPSIVLHELSHRMEYVVPGLQDELDAFWRQRTGHSLDDQEALQKLVDITGNHAYDEYEVTDPDRFTEAYMGKVYMRPRPVFDPDGHVRVEGASNAPHAGEIFTTGQEGVWHNRYDLMDTRWLGASERKAAEEYVDFILGLLATL